MMLESEVAFGVLLFRVTVLHSTCCGAGGGGHERHLLHGQHGGRGAQDAARQVELLHFKQLKHKLGRWKECQRMTVVHDWIWKDRRGAGRGGRLFVERDGLGHGQLQAIAGADNAVPVPLQYVLPG